MASEYLTGSVRTSLPWNNFLPLSAWCARKSSKIAFLMIPPLSPYLQKWCFEIRQYHSDLCSSLFCGWYTVIVLPTLFAILYVPIYLNHLSINISLPASHYVYLTIFSTYGDYTLPKPSLFSFYNLFLLPCPVPPSIPPSTECDNTGLIPLFSQSLRWMKERI